MAAREVFHEGEVAVQERTGERAIALHHGSILRETIPPAARAFLATQKMLAVGAADDAGRLWASLWSGARGFIQSDDAGTRLQVEPHGRSDGDPVWPLLAGGNAVGLLAIDLASRRRFRVNGVVGDSDEHGIEVLVNETFPNCPKYIQRREMLDGAPFEARPVEEGNRLDPQRRAFIAGSDTLFVASRHPRRGVDVSHRGGPRGFVHVVDERRLRVPDYAGNSMFQTLGNFEVDRHAGVTMVDFERGRLLAFTGVVSVSYGSEDPTLPTGGTGRYWDFTFDRWIELSLADGIGFRFVDASPFNP
jgi:predicted pyridoxine 5'-phosphate oxidase superfamily flavin-nucleotide-binding protein